MYLEGVGLKRGSDSLIQVPDRLVDLDSNDCFQVKIANTTKWRIVVRSGELLGHLFKADQTLKAAMDMMAPELQAFTRKASHLATLIMKLDSTAKGPQAAPTSYTLPPMPPGLEEVEPTNTEHLGWGPKTVDPGPDQIYLSKTFRESIDVDPQLNPSQCEALYRVVEKNQAAFGFDRRLGHLKLAPGTKPISIPPYYALPAN